MSSYGKWPTVTMRSIGVIELGVAVYEGVIGNWDTLFNAGVFGVLFLLQPELWKQIRRGGYNMGFIRGRFEFLDSMIASQNAGQTVETWLENERRLQLEPPPEEP